MKMIDLSVDLHDGMPTTQAYWHPKVEVVQLGFLEREGRNTHKFTLGTHTGTHMDAQYHFLEDGQTIDQVDPKWFVQKAALINLSNKGPESVITKEDLEPYEKALDQVEAVAVRTDWSDHWKTDQFYTGWPYYLPEAAQYLVDKGIKLVALDTPSPDTYKEIGTDTKSPIHHILLGNQIMIVEFLTNLKAIDAEFFTLYTFPLKLIGLDGGPSRVVAGVEETNE